MIYIDLKNLMQNKRNITYVEVQCMTCITQNLECDKWKYNFEGCHTKGEEYNLSVGCDKVKM